MKFTQFVYKDFNYSLASMMYSVYYNQFSVNSTTQYNWATENIATGITSLALSYRMLNGLTFKSAAEYRIDQRRISAYSSGIEKRISRGYLSLNYERNNLFLQNSLNFSLKYDLSFARTFCSTSFRKGYVNFSESAQGSLALGSGNNYVYKSNNPSVGKGGISLYTFLDLNGNGMYDKGEKMVRLTSVKIFGGKVIFVEKDSIVRMPDLNPFINYIIELDDNDLENLSWRFKHKIFKVMIDPNQFKRIDIPVISIGEVSGMVYLNTNGLTSGLGRITVEFYRKGETKQIAQTLTESDGSFYYLGLEPGEYIAKIDEKQLSILGYESTPGVINFKIKSLENGDEVSGLQFDLKAKLSNSSIEKNDLGILDKEKFDNSTVKDAMGESPDLKKIKAQNEISKKDSIRIASFKKMFLNDSTLILKNVFFHFDKSTLKSQSTKELDILVNLLNENPMIDCEISGHTDNKGSDAYNKKLSNDRAKAVVDYLMDQGIEPWRLTYRGYGFDRPIASNDSEEGRQLNRRTEFKIVNKNNVDIYYNNILVKVSSKKPANEDFNRETDPSPVGSSDKVLKDFGKIADIQKPFYSVQLGVFAKPVTSARFYDVSPIYYEILPNGYYRYVCGIFDAMKDAEDTQKRMITLGIKDAFVVAYKNGQKVAITELNKKSKKDE